MMKKKFVVCASFSILWCQNDKTSITMKCETIEKKLVFFIENKLEENEAQLVANHLNVCASCASKAEYLQTFWNDLEAEKNVQTKPFLYTRILVRMNQRAETKIRWIIAPASLAAVLVLGLLVGNWFAQTTANVPPTPEWTVAQLFDDTQLETIESILIEEE